MILFRDSKMIVLEDLLLSGGPEHVWGKQPPLDLNFRWTPAFSLIQSIWYTIKIYIIKIKKYIIKINLYV